MSRDLFGLTLSTGAVDAICQRASGALADPHIHLQDWVLDQDAVQIDETGWKTSGDGRALWTATTEAAAFLQIAERCNREQFQALVGSVCRDRDLRSLERLRASRSQPSTGVLVAHST